MGTILASTLITDASTMANDTMNVRWTKAELLDWLNAGQRAIVALAPESNVESKNLTVAANSPSFTLPGDYIALISITHNINLNVAGAVVSQGGAIRLVDRELLDSRYPDWPKKAATDITEKKAYMYDARSPKIIFVWPVHADAKQVVAQVVMNPTPCVAGASFISLSDEYAEALVDFMLFRAYAKDTDPNSAQKAQLYYTAFVNVVTSARTVKQSNEPNATVSSVALNPNVAQHYVRGA